jgi:hypothetical protein
VKSCRRRTPKRRSRDLEVRCIEYCQHQRVDTPIDWMNKVRHYLPKPESLEKRFQMGITVNEAKHDSLTDSERIAGYRQSYCRIASAEGRATISFVTTELDVG